MTWSVVWTLLPNGFEPLAPGAPPTAPRRARLSLVASLRNAGPGTTLGASPLARWPTFVAGLGPLSVVVNAGNVPSKLLPATVVSPAPDQALWDRLFAPTTPVDAYKPDAPVLTGAGDGSRAIAPAGGMLVETSHAHGAAARALAELYAEALRSSPTEPLKPDHPVAQAIAGVGAWAAPPVATTSPGGPADRAVAAVGPIEAGARAVQQTQVSSLLDPGSLTTARVEQAAALLRQQGQPGAAAAAPLAPVLRRLRLSGKPPAPAASRSNGSVNGSANGATHGALRTSFPAGTGGTGTPGGPPGTPGAPPSLLAGIRPAEQADFHQVTGLMLDHPALALRLGLRMDLTIEAFEGEASIRIAGAGGQPPQGPVPVEQPFCRVQSQPGINRFVMATQPLEVNEVVNGMLDLRSSTTLTPGRVVVSQLDVVGLTQQLHVLSTSRAIAAPGSTNGAASFAPPGAPHPEGSRAEEAEGITLPPRRDVGFTVSRVDRLSGAMGQTLARAPAFQEAVARPPAAPGDRAAGAAPDLFSDDATGGYRVDVSRNGGPYRSLMRRHITYRISGRAKGDVATVEAHDEGMVDPIIPMQQYDQEGNPHLLVGEELFGIDGWSLGAPRPGPKVVAEEAGGPTVAPVDPGPAPGYPLTIQNRVEPGTLPRLRYGSTYSFQARAVDLAGNSIGLEQADHTYVTPAEVYRRHEVVPTPVVIQRRVNAAGESLMHLAVFTDGDNNVLGGPSERHIAPPKAPQFLLETHGLFDEAIGPDNASRAAARKRMLDLARRESGSFLDPQVPNPNGSGTLVPAKGIAIVTNDPVKRPAVSKLPLPQGVPLRNGEYVIHDTPHVLCPYLPDVAAAGASFVGLPGGSGAIVVDYGNQSWPNLRPFRLEVRAATTAAGSHTVLTDAAGLKTLVVNVPPAGVVKARLASAITPAALAVMEPLEPKLQQLALTGQLSLYSPPRTLTLVHAVRRPLQAAKLILFGTHMDVNNPGLGSFWPRERGSTRVKLQGTIQPHAASTARVVVKAAWDELIDRPGQPVKTESRLETLGAFDVLQGQDVLGFGSGSLPSPVPPQPLLPATKPALDQVLGDQKHRAVRYSVTAATRFREYFLGIPEGDPRLLREGPEQTVHVLNASRPDPLPVHSIVPIYNWDRDLLAGQYTSTRRTSGVRVYLRRPWGPTGTDERLGVVVYDSAASAEANLGRNDPVCRLISRYALDPLEDAADVAAPPLLETSFPARKEVRKTMALLEPGRSRAPSSYGVSVVGHEVKYNAERDLWYADVEIAGLIDRFPFLRLGLVRFQPHSTAGCHVSRVDLPDPVQILPQRTLIASTSGPAREVVSVVVRGPRLQNTHLTAEHHRRVLDHTVTPPLEITEPSGPARPFNPIIGESTLPNLAETVNLFAPLPPAPAPQVVPAEYLGGRIVVREHQRGRNILSGANESRVIYFETFERNLPPNPTLNVSTTSVAVGGTVKVSWSGAVGATPKDWIGVFLMAESNRHHKTYQYTGGAPAGSLDFPLLQLPGTYNFRYFPNDDYLRTAVSVPVTVTNPPQTTVFVDRTTVKAGNLVNVIWAGAPNPTPTDWIGLFEEGAPNQIGPAYQYKTYQYTDGTAAGFRVFAIPLSVPPGEYEFRFLPNNGSVHTAASLPITVAAS